MVVENEDVEEIIVGVVGLSFGVIVFSWNIYGLINKGDVVVWWRMICSVVKYINLNVMFL